MEFIREFSLPNARASEMMGGLEPERSRYPRAQPPPLRDDAVERCLVLCGFGRRRAEGARSTRRALQNLLAAGFRFRLPTAQFRPRRPGSDAGFFCYGA